MIIENFVIITVNQYDAAVSYKLYEWQLNCAGVIIQKWVNEDRKRKALAALSSVILAEGMTKKRRSWESPLSKLRSEYGFHAAVFPTLCTMDNEFLTYFRMSVEKFEDVLTIVGPKIIKKHAVRTPISASERLCLTLRYGKFIK